MPRISLTEEARKQAALEKRMDKFDSVVTEYLRSSKTSVTEFSARLGIDVSTLWRYRHKPDSFANAPFGIITNALKIAHCPGECLRIICGW